MTQEMKIGDSAKTTIGDSGTTVGRPNSSLMNTVKNIILGGTLLTAAQEMLGARMKPGDSLNNTLGNGGEAFAKPGTSLGKMLMSGLLVEGAFKLMDAISGKPAQDIKAEAPKAAAADTTPQQPRTRSLFKPPSA